MVDRFKFRMFDKNCNKMWNEENDCFLETVFECLKQMIAFKSDNKDVRRLGYDHIADNRFFMQCTGVKDKNGKMIYEGDIVRVPDDYDEFGMMACEEREIWYKDGGFRLKPKDEFQLKKGARGHWLEDNNTFEIIGNIYENPELLESEE